MIEKRNSIFDSGVALAAITAFLYSTSTAYYGSYLRSLQLDTDILDRNFQEILYHGFVLSFVQIFYALLIYVSSCFLFSHGLLPYIRSRLQKSWKRKYRFLKDKHFILGKPTDPIIEQLAKRHTIAITIYPIAFFAVLLFLFILNLKEKKRPLQY
jgi:hypothetical protein